MDENTKLKFKCIRCGKCCIDYHTIVNVTNFDILRIRYELNLTLEELIQILGFYIFRDDITVETSKKMVISPIKTEKGLAFVGLLKKQDGSCLFYDDKKKKCLIYNVRPMFCRTFPFSFKILDNKLDINFRKIRIIYSKKGKEYCPGIGEDVPFIDIDEWKEVGIKTLENLRKNHLLIKRWNILVAENQITPRIKNFLQFLFKIDF